MPKNLLINSDLYALTFSSSNLEKINLIKDSIKTVPNSKISKLTTGNNHSLVVYKEVYEDVIDEGLDFVRINNLEEDVNWINKNNILIPCGFYQVASITPNDFDCSTYQLAFEYFDYVNSCLDSDLCYCFDYLSKTFSISLKDFNYEEAISKFNEFMLTDKNQVFDKIRLVSRYGKVINQEYPILSKIK